MCLIPQHAGQCPHPTCSKGLCGPSVNSAKVEKPCLIPRWLLKRCLLNEYIMENAVKYWVFTICHILNRVLALSVLNLPFAPQGFNHCELVGVSSLHPGPPASGTVPGTSGGFIRA